MQELPARPAPRDRVARRLIPTRARAIAALAIVAACSLLPLSTLGCGSAQHDDGQASTGRKRHSTRSLPTLHGSEEGDSDDDETDGVVHWEAKLTDDAPGLLAEFRRRASRYGCQTQADDDSVLARCAEAPIKLVKRGRNVSVACQGVSLPVCRDLFGRIVEVEKDKSGQNPRMW
jgi:hypothetical protein